MGICIIDSFSKSMALQAEIEGKKLTNQSARKTLLKKLKAADQPGLAIIGESANTNECPIADLQRRRQKCTMAHFFNHQQFRSSANNKPTSTCLPSLVSSVVAYTIMMNEEKMMIINHFQRCQISLLQSLHFWCGESCFTAKVVVDILFTWIDNLTVKNVYHLEGCFRLRI